MSSRPGNVKVRQPTLADAEAVLALQRAIDISEFGRADSDMEDLVQDWNQIDLARDAWLVFADGTMLIAYGAVIPRGDAVQHDVFVHPEWPDPDLGVALLAQCAARHQELLADDEGAPRAAVAYVAHTNARDIRSLEQADFARIRSHFQMRMTLEAPPELREPPEGVTIRRAILPDDVAAIHAVVEAAFAQPGREPRSLDAWRERMMQEETLEPDLWFVAVADDEVVGSSLGYIYPDLGWVRQLTVSPDWQGRGIGSALLRHSLRAYWERGFREVGLGVRADNPNAYRLYERVGMHRAAQYDEYRRTLP